MTMFENCRCSIIQSDSYGYFLNNTWNGVMALYEQNKVDLMLSGFAMRADRMRVIEFTTTLSPIE